MRTTTSRLAAVLLAVGLAPGTLVRSTQPPPNHDQVVKATALDAGVQRLGPFRLAGLWQLTSPNTLFGSYSALVAPAPDQLLAFSDRGDFLEFGPPGSDPAAVQIGQVHRNERGRRHYRDIEAATHDPASGRLFLALEGRNTIAIHRPGLTLEAEHTIPSARRWRENTGPEAMVRLSDGRFVILCECTPGWGRSGQHPALLLAGGPAAPASTAAFTFAGAPGYRPTDMAELPDGRVLVLLRRLTWPMPPRFKAKLMIADPAGIAAGGTWRADLLADLAAPFPLDNFEALTVTPGSEGQAIVWLLSDDNQALTQRTLLLKLELLLADLPAKTKAPGNPGALR